MTCVNSDVVRTRSLPKHHRGIPLSAYPDGTSTKLSGLFFTLSFNAERQAGKL